MKRQRKDIYQTITDRIVADLEQGVRSWLKPWSAENAADRLTRPLRALELSPANRRDLIRAPGGGHEFA